MYTTQAQLEERIGAAELLRLADRDGDGEADDGVIEQAIVEASATIDGFLAVRYRLPLAAVPAMLPPIAADLVLYALHPWGAPEELRRRYDDAMRRLKQIAEGTIRLDLEGVQPAGPGGPTLGGPERVFSRDSLKGF